MELPIYQRDSNGQYRQFYVTKLRINYRSHEAILRIASELFYDSELIPGVLPSHFNISRFESLLPNKDIPILVKNITNGKEQRIEGSFSWYNPAELMQVLCTTRQIISAGLNAAQIGIISPYRQQVKEIRKILSLAALGSIKVGTTEEFQGKAIYNIWIC